MSFVGIFLYLLVGYSVNRLLIKSGFPNELWLQIFIILLYPFVLVSAGYVMIICKFRSVKNHTLMMEELYKMKWSFNNL